jgi:hypothetical protein
VIPASRSAARAQEIIDEYAQSSEQGVEAQPRLTTVAI